MADQALVNGGIALAGTVVGFALATGRDVWQGRPQVSTELGRAAIFYARQIAGMEGKTWRYCDLAQSDAFLFVLVELLVHNASSRNDAVKGVRLILHRGEGLTINCPAMETGGSSFRGANITPYSLLNVRLRFQFERLNYSHFTEWFFDRGTLYPVEISTIRGQKLVLSIDAGGWTVAVVPEEDVSFDWWRVPPCQQRARLLLG